MASKYDVFISFRGTDIRGGFLVHLEKELKQKQIDVYVDDRLERGDEISVALLKAIEESLISLIIFSKDYASSKWCLEELVKIIDCKDRNEQIVIPVFYNTLPSDVRHQRGSYGDALAEHEKRNQENMSRVQIWRSVLEKAANLSGFHSSKYGDEVKLIEAIAKSLSNRLNTMYQSTDSRDLVGIDERIADLESLMCQGFEDVRSIGIWGMGGIGKTTIATIIFNRFCFEYEGYCFQANVREEAKRHGISYLKNKILSILLNENDLRIGTPNGVPPYVKRRLSRKKVLLVLDDINDSDQLENLVGAPDYFGLGSTIIVTSRDKQVLDKKVDKIYELEALNFDKSLQLFNLNAFKNNWLDNELIELSRRVVKYANGLPLALKVLGSFLYGKSKEQWESQLEKLEKVPFPKIHDVLRLSYDSLDHQEKNIFLYIACFFKKFEPDQIVAILDTFGFSTTIGLKDLKDKALITEVIDFKSGRLVVSMHDLIQEMGWEIVRQESIDDPGKRSLLWVPNDIFEVLKNDMGTEAIQSIILNMSKIEELSLNPQVFASMHKLKFLKFVQNDFEHRTLVRLPQGLGSLPKELRFLHWHCYPSKSFPLTFCAENLVELVMIGSHVEKLWGGVLRLVKLKKIDLSHSKHLQKLPDFSMANNLEEVTLYGCRSLHLVHPSILSLHKLVKLNLGLCTKLTGLRSDIHLKSLRDLFLHHCSRLTEFSMISENMRNLNLSGTAINELPSSIGCLSKLEKLILDDCRSLKNLPSKLANLRSLRSLSIFGCIQLQSLTELPPSIEELCATDCTSLETVPFTSMAADLHKVNRLVISFQNCVKLDEHSLNVIGINTHMNVQKCAYKHVSSVEECKMSWKMCQVPYLVIYPGSKVPEWFMYRASASITFAPHSKLQGLIFCVILSQHRSGNSYNYVRCDCFLENNNGERIFVTDMSATPWHYSFYDIECISDHVFLWYQDTCCNVDQSIQESRASYQHITYNPKVSFEFSAPKNYWDELDRTFIKECGVYPIYASEH